MAPASVFAGTNVTRREQFSELLGHNFRFATSVGDTVVAKLVSIDEGPQCPGLEQFSIAFEGESITEDLYEVRHPVIGKLNITLIRSGPPGSKRNRHRAYFSNFA
jgi:hypothetical protein